MKVTQLEADKAEVEMREQVLKENLNNLKLQKERTEHDLSTQTAQEKNELQK